MLGWGIYIYELSQGIDLKSPISEKTILSEWTSSLGGLDWIDDLVKEGKAEELEGYNHGYTFMYKAKVQDVLDKLTYHIPKGKDQTVIGDDYVMSSDWRSKIDTSEIAKCKPDEQLIVEAWDLS